MANKFTDIPTTEPAELIAGDLWTWKRTDLGSDYLNSLYTLTYKLRPEGATTGTTLTITATASGADYLVSVAAATTAGYAAGEYNWSAFITRDSDSERFQVDYGTLTVKPDLAVATTDPRSHAKITLDALESVIEDRATKDQMSYSIGGRSLSRMSVDDLLKFRNTYRAEVKKEDRAEARRNGKGNKGRVLVRFGNAS